MKKKGFTIIELLAVVVILVAIAGITASAVVNILDRTRNQAFNQMIDNVENVSRLYVSNNRDNIPNLTVVGSNIYLTLQDLVDKGMIKAPVLDPKTGEEIPLNTRILVHVLTKNKYYIFFEYGDLNRMSNFAAPKNVTATAGLVTSKSIEVIAGATTKYGTIVGYKFSKDNGVTWTDYQTGTSYVFDNLTTGTYQLKVKAKNSYGSESESTAISRATTALTTPTYSINTTGWATSKTVTVNYLTPNYTKQYSTNGGTSWSTASAQTQAVPFSANGNVIARITDGINTITASVYNVTQIDTTAPTNPSIAKNTYYFTVTGGTDSGSGVNRTTYSLSGATTASETTYSGNVSATNIGTTTLTAKTYDNVGNASSSTSNIVVAASTCPSGYSKTGTTCRETQNATVASYSCPSGYSWDGSNCYTTSSASTGYSCPSGYSLSGTTCYTTTSASVSYSCPSGWSQSGSTCYYSTSASSYYTCPSGGSLSGSTCTVAGSSYTVYSTFTKSLSCSSGSWAWAGQSCSGNCDAPCADGLHSRNAGPYSDNCPSGSCSPNGSTTSCSEYWSGTCYYSDTTYSASLAYSCPSGYSLSGSTCTTSQSASSSYYCSSGWSLSGSTCYYYTSSSSYYYCSSGWSLSGSTCYYYVSGSPTYSCSSGWTLSGSSCYRDTTPICSVGTYLSSYDKCFQ